MEGLTGLANVFIIGLAVSQLVEVMRHSELSLPLRIWAMNAASGGGFRGFFAKVVSCPFCLSHWVSGGFTLLLFIALWQFWPMQILAFIFAATRVANLSNDIFHDQLQTPQHEIVEDEDLEEQISDED